jgi:hypothetical protein
MWASKAELQSTKLHASDNKFQVPYDMPVKTTARFTNKESDIINITYAVLRHTKSGIQRTCTLTTEEVKG